MKAKLLMQRGCHKIYILDLTNTRVLLSTQCARGGADVKQDPRKATLATVTDCDRTKVTIICLRQSSLTVARQRQA